MKINQLIFNFSLDKNFCSTKSLTKKKLNFVFLQEMFFFQNVQPNSRLGPIRPLNKQ